MKLSPNHIQKSLEVETGFSTGWGVIGGFITLVCLTFWISEAHLLKQEEDLRGVFIPSVSLVRARTDSRLGNRFSSNPAAIDYLSQLNSDVIAMVSARIPLSFLSEQESRGTPAVFPVLSTEVYFVTSNFFKFTQGDFIAVGSGTEGRADALRSNSNSAVIGKGLCRQISGKNETCPGFIYVKGRPFRVSGVIDFSARQASENKVVFLPLSALRLITNIDKTFISKFAIASPSARALEALKESISRLQLIRDNTLMRPAFEPIPVPVSFRTRFLFSEHFNPLRFVLYFIWIVFVGSSLAYLIWKEKTQPLVTFWKRSLGRSPLQLANDQLVLFVRVHQEYQRIAIGIVLFTLWILKIRHPDFFLFTWETCKRPLLTYGLSVTIICGMVYCASLLTFVWSLRGNSSHSQGHQKVRIPVYE